MDALVRDLEVRSTELTRRVVAEMYEDPFWLERYGDRGRRFSEEDGGYHLSYLVSALSLSNPGILTGYARWLQTLLVTRGMCTRHIAENFERLARAIEREIPDAQPAIELLRAAQEALRYERGPGRELQDLSERVADAVLARGASAGQGLGRKDVLDLVGYLSDAVAHGRPELFAAHVGWLAGFFARRGVPGEHLRATLERIGLVLVEQVDASEGLRTAARDGLVQALARLSAPPEPSPTAGRSHRR